MKLVFFINNLAGGGAERVVATLGNYWASKHWDITIVTLGSKSLDFYSLNPAIMRISLGFSGNSKHVLDALLQNMRRVIALRRIIKQVQPKVVLSMMSTPNVLLAFASRGIPGLCAIGSERCYPPHSPLGPLWNTLRKKMYVRLSAVVALTQECAEWIKIHSSAKRVPIIPNAVCWPVPDNLPRIVPNAICSPERKILLAVGRLGKVKNFGLLIKVFSELAFKYPGWDLVILGDGQERQILEAQIRETMLTTRIFIPGIAGNVAEWYTRADLYVMSSRSEGFPNALVEALAYGLPAVSFDCDTGPRDIIRHGVDGLLVPPGNEQGLLVALERLMGDSDLRKTMAYRAIDARERFSIEKIAGMWENLFRDLSDPEFAPESNRSVSINTRCSS